MGTESGRGSLTGAAAAPACPSVKARASAASLPPLLSVLPLRTPPPAAGRAAAQAHRAPVGPQRPDRRGFAPRPRRKRRPAFHLPPPAAASGCPRGARAEPCLTHARPVPLAWYPRPSPCAGAAILAGVGSDQGGSAGPERRPRLLDFPPTQLNNYANVFFSRRKGRETALEGCSLFP